jgi:hypothetical protein
MKCVKNIFKINLHLLHSVDRWEFFPFIQIEMVHGAERSKKPDLRSSGILSGVVW